MVTPNVFFPLIFGAAKAQCSKYLSSFEARNLALSAWALAKMGSIEPWSAKLLEGKMR